MERGERGRGRKRSSHVAWEDQWEGVQVQPSPPYECIRQIRVEILQPSPNAPVPSLKELLPPFCKCGVVEMAAFFSKSKKGFVQFFSAAAAVEALVSLHRKNVGGNILVLSLSTDVTPLGSDLTVFSEDRNAAQMVEHLAHKYFGKDKAPLTRQDQHQGQAARPATIQFASVSEARSAIATMQTKLLEDLKILLVGCVDLTGMTKKPAGGPGSNINNLDPRTTMTEALSGAMKGQRVSVRDNIIARSQQPLQQPTVQPKPSRVEEDDWDIAMSGKPAAPSGPSTSAPVPPPAPGGGAPGGVPALLPPALTGTAPPLPGVAGALGAPGMGVPQAHQMLADGMNMSPSDLVEGLSVLQRLIFETTPAQAQPSFPGAPPATAAAAATNAPALPAAPSAPAPAAPGQPAAAPPPMIPVSPPEPAEVAEPLPTSFAPINIKVNSNSRIR